jgi:hypothetical protein
MIVVLGVLLAGTVAPIGDGNALTLPAARHLVRMDTGGGRPPAWLLAIQQDGADGHGLWFLRSDDAGANWSSYAPIQDDASERDTPDLITVGNDIALVYSYEGPTLGGSARHDVFFQWWRWDGRNDWSPSPPVRVFDSTSTTTAYYRGLIALDSVGRIWVQAFRLNTDGTHTAAISVSADGGTTFAQQPSLATLGTRAGGRLISLGTQLMFLYGTHGCCDPGRMRLRDDAAPLSTWSSAAAVLSDGIYHGAALSAVADGAGGLHLVYKNVAEKLYYRRYDGRAWSGATLIEGTPNWALQPAVTRLGDDLVVFYNHMVTNNTSYRFLYKTLHGGSFSSATTLDSSGGFKGYPAAAETLPTSTVDVPCVFGKTPNASSSGNATVVLGKAPAPGAAPPPPPPPDGGVPDAGTDAGVPDAGSDAGVPDGGTDGGTPQPPPPSSGVLFSDAFNRNDLSGLGSRWTVSSGAYITDSRANADRDGFDQAYVRGVTCADCRIDARMVGFGTEMALTLRGNTAAPKDRYDLAITSAGRLRIRRWRSGSATVLGDVASGIPYLNEWASFSFTVSGTAPVMLTGAVNGATKLTVTDGSSAALTAPGLAGMTNTMSGSWVDDFKLTALGTATPPSPDGGTPDAGADAGTPPDGGTIPDGGAIPDGGTDGGVAGTRLLLDVIASGQNQILAVDQAGTVYSTSVGDSGRQLYASTDGARTWARRGVATGNFRAVTVLSDGTLLAQVDESSGHFLARSADHGATWTDVRALGNYMGLTPHSFAELDGVVYFVEYQVFSRNDTPIHLWASADRGRTWSVRFRFDGTRHAHGLAADATRHALWAFFGDTDQQSRTLRSTDAGATWTEVIHTQLGGQVDATVLADGSLLYGQDITYLPDEPWVVKLGIDGTLTSYLRLPGPGYSMHALPGGGYVLGVARETGGDVYPSGNVSARVYTSVDGVHWEQVLQYPRLSSSDDVRADVFWALPDGDLLLELRGARVFSSGTGYQILHPRFQ